jgi:hypothetical protein
VCQHGRVCVIGDDELHLAVFDDAQSAGRLHRLLPGALPRGAKARKLAKPDFETLLLLAPDRLVALGSGSRATRERGVVLRLDAQGRPQGAPHGFDLAPLYGPLRARCGGELNVEGALVRGGECLLLHRGVAGRHQNALARYALSDLHALIDGRAGLLPPRALQPWPLGDIEGVALGFTDACALPGGAWLYSAAAEVRDDSVADGPCAGSVLGLVGADGALRWQRRFAGRDKVEGIAARARGGRIDLCWVTDADDPARASHLWRAAISA